MMILVRSFKVSWHGCLDESNPVKYQNKLYLGVFIFAPFPEWNHP